MSNKTAAMVAYITIIGWIISYLEFKKQTVKSPLVAYHLGQGLGLFIVSLIVTIAVNILFRVLPGMIGTIGTVGWVLNVGLLILFILGIINANKESMQPLPLIGKMFEGRFDFLK